MVQSETTAFHTSSSFVCLFIQTTSLRESIQSSQNKTRRRAMAFVVCRVKSETKEYTETTEEEEETKVNKNELNRVRLLCFSSSRCRCWSHRTHTHILMIR